MTLQRFQLDLAARLQSTPLFACIPVFVLRPRAALTAAQIRDRINSALGALTTQNGQAASAPRSSCPSSPRKNRTFRALIFI